MIAKVSTPLSVRYGEFPELLFGTSANGTAYFDATLYIAEKGDVNTHSPANFIRKFSFWFEIMKIAYEIADNEMIITDEATGHILIDESLALLFVAYIDPGFGAYMLERVSEMLLDGITLSDTHIMQIIRNRLTKEYILSNLKEE